MRGSSLLPRKLVLDTSVLIEYIVAESPYRAFLEDIFSRAKRGEIEVYVNTVTLAELLYVATRVYREAGVENPNKEAEIFATWVTRRARIVNIDAYTSLLAAELKKSLGIALADCLVIATARRVDGNPLFKRVEVEMRKVENKLRKLGVLFLEELVKNK